MRQLRGVRGLGWQTYYTSLTTWVWSPKLTLEGGGIGNLYLPFHSLQTFLLSMCSLREAASPQVQLTPAVCSDHFNTCMNMIYLQNDLWQGSDTLCSKKMKGRSIVMFVQSGTIWALWSSSLQRVLESPILFCPVSSSFWNFLQEDGQREYAKNERATLKK